MDGLHSQVTAPSPSGPPGSHRLPGELRQLALFDQCPGCTDGTPFSIIPASEGVALGLAFSPSVLSVSFLIRGANRDLVRGKYKEDSLWDK